MSYILQYLVVLLVVFSFAIEASAKKNVKISKSGFKAKTMMMKAAYGRGDCRLALSFAREILELKKDNIKAYRVIDKCTRKAEEASYKSAAKEVFEKSKLLSLIPKVLEMAKVKDLIPVINEVETKGTKDVTDYLMLTELYSKLGEPEKQIKALEKAVKLDPNDPRPKLLLASKKFDKGDRESARKLYKEYLYASKKDLKSAYMTIYVAAMAYPIPIAGALVFLCLLLGGKIFKRAREQMEEMDADFKSGRARKALNVIVYLIPIILAFQFWSTGEVFPVGLMLLSIFAEGVVLVSPTFLKIIKPVVKFATYHYKSIFSVRFSKSMSRVPKSWRILIAILNIFVLGTVAPIIKQPDFRYGLILTCVFVFLGTIGSLVVTFLQANKHLEISLRWICVAATIPFLLVFILSRWSEIGTPLMYGRWPSQVAIDSLINYLVFWGLSVFLAFHLSKIVAGAIIEPLREIINKIGLIEKGDFKARVEVKAENELGVLGTSINEMVVGLERREFVEKTFHRYVDPQVASRILDDTSDSIGVETQRMHAVVMFVDIRGFTTLSEKMSPEEVVEILNHYFESMVSIIQCDGGVIDKFIGDAILAVWGVPHPLEDAEKKALHAAVGIRNKMKDINKILVEKGHPKVDVGIGLNAGPVVAGSIGNSEHMEYTVVGDVVNTAQRVESMAKRGEVLLTKDVYDKVENYCEAHSQDPVKLKGKAEEMVFWSVDRLN